MTAPRALGRRELLETTRASRAALDALLDGMTPEQLTDGSLDGGRSAKDVLAHVTLWERLMCNAIEASLRGETPAWPEPGSTIADLDKINEREFLANSGRQIADIRHESAETYARALRVVESLSEEQVSDPRAFAWIADRGFPLSVMIRANMDEHYDEHAEQISAWLASQGD